jgi:signal transduction histidine kinase
LIDQLLSLARLERTPDHLDLHPEDPAALVRQAADAAGGRAEDKHVKLEIAIEPDLPPVGIDPQRFARALGNLVDNAITYTPVGGRVTLSAGPGGDGRVIISVADTGIGIPPEYLPHVFDRFFRVPGQTDAGTGLGLAIVKEVVTAHHGEVSCDSRPGDGTVFRITLPAWKGGGPGRATP